MARRWWSNRRSRSLRRFGPGTSRVSGRHHCRILDRDRQLPALDVHPQRSAVVDVSGDQGSADLRFELALQEALERPGAVDRIEAFAGDQGAGRGRKLQTDVAVGEALPEIRRLEIDDLFDLRQGERPEQHYVVDPVQELGPEMATQFAHHLVSRLLGDLAFG